MSDPHPTATTVRHRCLFLSDLHLGAVGSRADLVLRFLRRNRADRYVLVGDILDIWNPVVPNWGVAQQGVIEHLRTRHGEGAEIRYVRGNHDPAPEAAPADRRLPVVAEDRLLHDAADGRRYLVIHGDGADRRLFRSRLLTQAGSRVDRALRGFDLMLRRRFADETMPEGPHQRSAIEWALASVNVLLYLDRTHERRLVEAARAHGADGVICGHFHLARLHDRHGLVYANCGDWFDSFTALAEDHSGRLSLVGGRAALAPLPRPPLPVEPVEA
jgi:UDP-2,3-diacylglucosamine pyrophosphatase LpxH